MTRVPTPAATVMLLRDGPDSPSVLMLERHSRSEVLPDLYVFPGGRVDEADRELAHTIQSEQAMRIGGPPAEAAAFLVAAIRETFEEAGILLARRRGEAALLEGDALAALLGHREDLRSGALRFAELIRREGLELASERLVAHARWVTPVLAPLRFDTVFFTALAPADQQVFHDGVEASAHVWIRPEDALAELEQGARRIVFPTACNLETLAGFASSEQALEASRRRAVVTVTPVLHERGGRQMLMIPTDIGYRRTEEPLDGLPRSLFRGG